ncbi:MAG: hypothetical protein QOJ54_680, partial [Aliidongia sp.]|nr:hypothetical protein [Aliidongia sp.]
EMVLRGWSWADVSRALFKAGICYGTGRPIPDASLRAKAYRARLRNRAAAALDLPPKVEPATAPDDPVPAFAPVALRDGARPTGLAADPAVPPRSPIIGQGTADEVFERVFGRKPSHQEEQP